MECIASECLNLQCHCVQRECCTYGVVGREERFNVTRTWSGARVLFALRGIIDCHVTRTGATPPAASPGSRGQGCRRKEGKPRNKAQLRFCHTRASAWTQEREYYQCARSTYLSRIKNCALQKREAREIFSLLFSLLLRERKEPGRVFLCLIQAQEAR